MPPGMTACEKLDLLPRRRVTAQAAPAVLQHESITSSLAVPVLVWAVPKDLIVKAGHVLVGGESVVVQFGGDRTWAVLGSLATRASGGPRTVVRQVIADLEEVQLVSVWGPGDALTLSDIHPDLQAAWVSLRLGAEIAPGLPDPFVATSFLLYRGESFPLEQVFRITSAPMQGLAGPQGFAGLEGRSGVPGPPGVRGEAGQDGIPGPQGPQGLPGNSGRLGARGPRGLPAEEG